MDRGQAVIRAWLRDTRAPARGALLGGAAIAAAAGGVEALWAGPVVPDPVTWLVLVLLAAPAAGSVLVPVAGVAAAVGALARWEREGAWAGLRACGRSGRELLVGAALVGCLTGAGTAAFTLGLEPAAHSAAKRAVVEGAARFEPWPGQATSLGRLEIWPRRVEGGVAREIFLASGDAVGSADRARLVATGEGTAVELRGGALALRGARISWDRWLWALPATSPRRELAERGLRELAGVAARTERAGGDASYERAVLLKRLLHPLAAAVLPVALLPLGCRRRPWAGAAAVGVAYLAAVRAGDHLASALGPWAAASSGPLLAIAAGLGLWLAWRDR